MFNFERFGFGKKEEKEEVKPAAFKEALIKTPVESLSIEELKKLREELSEQYKEGLSAEQINSLDSKLEEVNLQLEATRAKTEIETPSWSKDQNASEKEQEAEEVLEVKEESPENNVTEEGEVEKISEKGPSVIPAEKLINMSLEGKSKEALGKIKEDVESHLSQQDLNEEEKRELHNMSEEIDLLINERESERVTQEGVKEIIPDEPSLNNVEGEVKEAEASEKETSAAGPEAEKALEEDQEKAKEEIEKELEKIPEKDRMSMWEGLVNVGYLVDGGKNLFLSDILTKIIGDEKDKKAEAGKEAGTKTEKKQFLSERVKKALKGQRDDYRAEAESVMAKMENQKRKEGQSSISLHPLGSVARLYRSIAKPVSIIAGVTGGTLMSSFKGVMLLGATTQWFSRIAKDYRLADESVIEKTRISEEQDAFDEFLKIKEKDKEIKFNKVKNDSVDKAHEEALAMSDEDWNEEGISGEAFDEAYLSRMPEDLKERIKRSPREALSFVQSVVNGAMTDEVERLNKKVDRIQSNKDLSDAEKDERIQILLRTQKRNLRDYDRIITQYGTVDTFATAAMYAQRAGKQVVNIATVLSLSHLVENIKNLVSHPDFIQNTEHGVSNIAHNSVEKIRDLFGIDHAAAPRSMPSPVASPDMAAINNPVSPDTIAAHHAASSNIFTPSHPESPDTVVAPDTATMPHTVSPDTVEASHPVTPDTTAIPHAAAPDTLDASHASAAADSIPAHPAEGPIPSEINGLEGGHIPTPENVEIIHKGSSVIGTMENMVREGKITESQYLAALHNPESVSLVHGVPTHVSHISLTHEGNGIRFIAGENGGAPRFEVIEADGTPLGNDQDLANAYEKLGKKPPEWLEKALHGDAAAAHDAALPDHAATPDVGHTEIPAHDHDVSGVADKTPDYVGHYNEAGDYNAALGEHGYEANTEAHVTTPSVEHTAPTGEMSLESIPTPEDILQGQEMVADLNYQFDIMPLLNQENIVRGLGPVHDRLDQALASGQEFSNRSEMIETRDMIERMQRTMLETERAFRDKLYGLGFRKPGEYERIFGQNKISVKTLLENAESSHDNRIERLANLVLKQKPNNREKMVDVTTFLKSRFR